MTPAQEFLSTPSVRRATAGAQADPPRRQISIHALRAEGDHDAYYAGDRIT